jgi:transposase
MSLSLKKRWEIIFLSTNRKGPKLGIRDVAKEVGVSNSTVQKWLKRYHQTGDVNEEERSGRPKLKSSKMEKIILSTMMEDREISSNDINNKLKRAHIEVSNRTVRRRLAEHGFYSGTPTNKPFLKSEHIEKRLKWANSNLDRDWKSVIFTDETTIQLFQNPSRVWKRKGEIIVAPTVKHPPKVHVWGCFSSKGFGKLIIFTDILDSFKMCKIYKKSLLPIAQKWFGNDWTLCEDNNPKHTSRYSKQWKLEHSVERMNWPAQSPDQNPIENVWHLLKYKVAKRHPKTIKQLKRTIQLIWKNFDQNLAQKFSNSMSNQIQALIEAKGGVTIY